MAVDWGQDVIFFSTEDTMKMTENGVCARAHVFGHMCQSWVYRVH